MSDKDNTILIQKEDGSVTELDILQVQNTGTTDDMDRPLWVDQFGAIWVDVNINNTNPCLYDTCKIGEPCCPIPFVWEENNDLYNEKELYKISGGLK